MLLPWLLLPCKITKVSGWNVQQKMDIPDWVIVVSVYYMYGIKLFSFTDYCICGQKIMNEQATSICCG